MSLFEEPGCGCHCHTSPFVSHVMACCDAPPMTMEEYEQRFGGRFVQRVEEPVDGAADQPDR